MKRHNAWLLVALAVLSALPQRTTYAQKHPTHVPTDTNATRATFRTVAGDFRAGGLWRFIFGSTWRDVWSTPIDVPVLDLARFGNGLTPFKEGGNQSRTLHFHGADQREYVFRTAQKRLPPRFDKDLQHTPVGNLLNDQLSTLHPANAAIANVLQDATGVLHAEPTLVVLPNDERLGAFRSSFAGALGYIEIKPDEVPEGVEPFAGSSKIRGSDKLLAWLEEGLNHRFDARGWLTSRLLDEIVGDFDRGGDNWDWACYERGNVCRPIARDRDWAFMHANGLALKPVRHFVLRYGSYDRTEDDIRRITTMTHEFDRSHLVALDRAVWDSIVNAIQWALGDSVLDAAIRAQPAAYHNLEASTLILRGMRARRDRLKIVARQYYALVNEYADVFAADGRERAEIDRLADGSVRVRLWRLTETGQDSLPAFDRTFDPGETREIRVSMQDNDDIVVVRGSAAHSIPVRVIGGAGNDALTDSSSVRAGGTWTKFYDAHGANRIERGPDSSVDTGPFTMRQPEVVDKKDSALVKPRTVNEERRGRFEDQRGTVVSLHGPSEPFPKDWGSNFSMHPTAAFETGVGPMLLLGATHTQYGFRRAPFRFQTSTHLVVARTGVGIRVGEEWHAANSRFGARTQLQASTYGFTHFFGYGNASPSAVERDVRIPRDEAIASVALTWELGSRSTFGIGPIARIVRSHVPEGAPIESDDPIRGTFGAAGAQATLNFVRVDNPYNAHRGIRVDGVSTIYARSRDRDSVFGRAEGSITAYVPLFAPTLALRIGGSRAWGAYPIHEAASIGGLRTLPGYSLGRYSGDAAVSGSAELRIPLFRMTLLTRGRLGLVGRADAGRVWFNGKSDGDWHTGVGGGLSFTTFSRFSSLLVERGERTRVYVQVGG